MGNVMKQPLIHVVATVNPDEASGEILYVNPSRVASQGAMPAVKNNVNVSLVVKDRAGKELLRVKPEVRFDSCPDEEAPRTGLIQQDIAALDGMYELELMVGRKTVATFTGGDDAGSPEIVMGVAPPQADSPQRRAIAPTTRVPEEPGVSFTVQARPDNQMSWTTLAVGQKQPEIDIDKNQFPGASKLRVRVVRSTGFTTEVVDEREVSVDR